MRILQMLCLGGGLSAALAHADQLALIENSGQSAQGVLAVNQAAGDANQQGNLQALAVASGVAQASIRPWPSKTCAPALAVLRLPAARVCWR